MAPPRYARVAWRAQMRSAARGRGSAQRAYCGTKPVRLMICAHAAE